MYSPLRSSVVNTENDVMSDQYNNIAKKCPNGPFFSAVFTNEVQKTVAFSSLQVNVSVQKKNFFAMFFFQKSDFFLLLSLNSSRNLITEEKQNISLISTLDGAQASLIS